MQCNKSSCKMEVYSNSPTLRNKKNFSCEAVWTWAFVCWKIFDYSFNFRACDGSVKVFYLFLVEFWKVVFF